MSSLGPKIQGVVPVDQLPDVLRGHPELVGVFIGGCVERGVGSSFRAQAHAHTGGPKTGWICIRGWRRLYQRALLIHELAHILTSAGHDDRWRKKLRELGGRLPTRYQKKVRKPCACGAHKFSNEGAQWFAADNRWHSWKGCRIATNMGISTSTLTRAAACRSSAPVDPPTTAAQEQGAAMHRFILAMMGGTE